MNLKDIQTLEELVLVKDAVGYEVETLAHYLIDDVYIKPFVAKKAGTFMGQHAHAYDHAHLVASGAMRVFIDGLAAGDYKAGQVVEIKAGLKHVLLSLEDNTIGVCIHNTHGETEPLVTEKAELWR